jgi:hypothetical protein
MKMKATMTAALAVLLLSAGAKADETKPDAGNSASAAPAASAASAASAARESVMTFFRHLKLALTDSAVAGERKKNRSAAVAAVRGAGQSSELANPDEPSLKGDAAAAKIQAARAEDAEIEKALDLLIAGKTDEGIKALEAFKTSHPKSRSLPDVQQALDKAKSLNDGAAAAPAPAPAAAAAPAKS